MRLVLPLVAVASSLLANGCCSSCGTCKMFSCSQKPAAADVASTTSTAPKATVAAKTPRTDAAVQQVGAVQPPATKSFSTPATKPSTAQPMLPDSPPSAKINIPAPPATATLSQREASLPTPGQIAAQKNSPSLPALPAGTEEESASTGPTPVASSRQNLSWTPSMPPRTASSNRSN